jgi:hypothetical protein
MLGEETVVGCGTLESSKDLKDCSTEVIDKRELVRTAKEISYSHTTHEASIISMNEHIH